METHFTMDAPCVDLYNEEEYVANLNSSNQEYINARKNLKIDINKFYLWLYRSIWDCDLKINATAKIGQELFGGNNNSQNYYTTTITSVEKVGIVQHGRDRKKAITDSLGRTTLIDDESNLLPDKYPKEILYKIRSNPCFPISGSTVYFDCVQRFANVVYSVRFKDLPAPKFPFNSSFENVSLSRREFGNLYFYIYSGTRYVQAKCNIFIDPLKSVYDYSLKKYIPNVYFTDSAVTWVGLQTSDQNKKSTLTVDGVSIQSSTAFDYGQFSGTPDDPNETRLLDINLNWTTKKREL